MSEEKQKLLARFKSTLCFYDEVLKAPPGVKDATEIYYEALVEKVDDLSHLEEALAQIEQLQEVIRASKS